MSNYQELKPLEISAFKELRDLVAEEFGSNVSDDRKIIRFLKARDFHVKNAYTMLKKDLEWRKQYSIDTILQDYDEKRKEFISKYYPVNIIGYDKNNSSILVTNYGTIDYKGLVKSLKKEEIILYASYILELCGHWLQEHSKEVGVSIDTWTVIADMNSLSYYQFASKRVIELISELCLLNDSHYPETLKVMHIINSSAPFLLIYSIIKPFIATKTQEKIKIYGREGWKEELLKIIDPEVLPAYLGGKRTDPDGNPMCNSFISHGEAVPEKFYMENCRKSLKNEPGVRSRVLKRRSQLNVPLYVQKEGSYIEWEFETADHDIGFGLFYKDFDSNEEDKMLPMIPIKRFDAYLQSEIGMLKCEKPGIYIFTLDNSYSRLRSKNIHYKLSIVKPGEKMVDI